MSFLKRVVKNRTYSLHFESSLKWSIIRDSVLKTAFNIYNLRKMNEIEPRHPFTPPENVRDMKILNRDKFTKTVHIQGVILPVKKLAEVKKPQVKRCLLRIPNTRSIVPCTEKAFQGTHKFVLLDPRHSEEFLESQAFSDVKLEVKDVHLTLTYNNWSFEEIMRAVLPPEAPVSGFSLIGHIVHFNLRDEILDYKSIIGK